MKPLLPLFYGTIQFNDQFYLKNVLYIPNFYTNLIYVPILTYSLDCNVTFTSFDCIINGEPYPDEH